MAEITWAHLVNGDFADGADWKGGVVPGASDDAILSSGGTPYTVTSSANETVNSIQTAAPTTLSIYGGTFTATNGTGSGANDGTIAVVGQFDVGGAIDNVGSIELNRASTMLVSSGGVTLTGGGAISFNTTISGVLLNGGPLTNVDNTLTGEVDLHVDGLTNEAGGVIDGTFGGSIAVEQSNGGAATLVNQGLIESSVTDARAMGVSASTVNNSGGTILAGDDTVLFLNGFVSGGTIESEGTGYIQINNLRTFPEVFDGTSSSIIDRANVEIHDGYTLTIQGAIQNYGTISVDGTKGPAYLKVGSTGVTLSGGGSIDLSAAGHNFIRSATSSAETLTNVDNTISGSGSVGMGTLGIDNEAAGVINATGTVTLTLDTGTNAFANAGLLEGTGKGGLTIKTSTIDDTGGGTISSGTGSHVTLDGVDVEGGTLASVGTGMIKVLGSGNTIAGATSGIDVTGELLVLAGASLTGTGAVVLNDKLIAKGDASLGGPLVDDGTLEVAGGSISVTGAVSGTGEALIDGGTMSFGSTFSQKVVFDGSGELILAGSQGYAGMVWKFSSAGATSLDLQDIAFTGATVSYSGNTGQGVLTVTSGAEVAHITLKGNYLGTIFDLSGDTGGGTIITGATPESPAVATIAQAIAAFAPAQAASTGVTDSVDHHAPVMLTRPGTSAA